MGATIQTYLPMSVELRLPTLDMTGARAMLGQGERLIREQVEIRALVCWDIARSQERIGQMAEGRGRRELRFLAESVKGWPAQREWTDGELAERLFGRLGVGQVRRFVRATDFCRAFNCDGGHVLNLVSDGTLSVLDGCEWGPGRGRTPALTWGSVARFCAQRRIA